MIEFNYIRKKMKAVYRVLEEAITDFPKFAELKPQDMYKF